jgi:hypothetical protein
MLTPVVMAVMITHRKMVSFKQIHLLPVQPFGSMIDLETIITHCAGMDVHQKNIVVCVMVGSSDDMPSVETRSFPSTTKYLYEMLRWLESKVVTHIALESTGVYWKPVLQHLGRLF